MEPRDVVQAAIDAYHAHDLDRCLSYYAPDVVVKGADTNRIALGDYVIDEERVTGSPGRPEVVRAALVYRFENGLIQEILILS